MRYRRWISIILAFVLFLCASTYMVAASDNYRHLSLYGLSGIGHQIVYLLLGGKLLNALLCILLGIVLLIDNNGYENPLRIAFWGSGAVFMAIPNIVLSYNLFIKYSAQNFDQSFRTLALIACAVSAACGIAACIYAIILNRYLVSGKLQRLAAGSPEKELKDLEYLKRTGLITVDEYEQIRQRFAGEMKLDH